ncbi:hypothetical protein QR680_001082 [Steinernema hermaphroditum]|uniref:Uncharacterized protein n=1 Tax=Steinernema hermaphroditum TaxID=289476 RepID=A0AA39LES7_9BILA|nr:hypothetical protein QR680_001082 [Steinernema hermaphroditum]
MDPEHRLCRARSLTMLRASSADLRQRFLVPRSASVSDLRGNRMPWSYRPKTTYYDSWYGNYLSNRFSGAVTRRPYLYSNFSSDYSWSPFYFSYPSYRYRSSTYHPIYYSYYYRPWTYYTSTEPDFLFDRIYGWERDRYYIPTSYYRRPRSYYASWLY